MVVTLSSLHKPDINLLLVINIAIQYSRIMTINYGKRMGDTDFRKLSAELSEKGFLICHLMNVADSADFGFIATEKTKISYDIVDGDEYIMSVDYRHTASYIKAGFSKVMPNIDFNRVSTATTKKVWAEPKGDTVVFTGHTDGNKNNYNDYGINNLKYYDDVYMRTQVTNGYEGLTLKFTVTWDCITIQRKEMIEEMMVQEVLADMGRLQKVFEGRLKLKKFGYDINDVTINCHFDAKTESRSECTPDIVKQVRDARKGV